MLLGYPALGTMKRRRLVLPPCPYLTGPYVFIVMTLIMALLSVPTHITYVLTASRASSLRTISTLVNTAWLTHVVISWITSWMLFQKVIKTWMKETFPIDTWKYQGRGGVVS
jgi:hypothetical protein